MVIDGHGHACGSYLNAQKIIEKLMQDNVDMVLLTPGQLNSSKVYKMAKKAEKKPYEDIILNQNKTIRFFLQLIRAIKQIPQGNNIVYKIKKEIPDKVRQCYWITKENWKDINRDYEKMNFDAVKLHQCWEKFKVDDNWFEGIIKWIIEKDIPLFIHMYNYNEVKKLISCIKKHPKAKIIIAHLFGMELFLKEDIKYFDNVYFDISNCYFVSKERIFMAYKRFGSKKLILGSDTPYGVDSLKHTINNVELLSITESEKNDILGENLKKLIIN